MPVAIILDLMLPRLDGIGVYRAVCQFSDVPIVMLTARAAELDRLPGLDTGAADSVCEPFSPGELMARLRALLRRAEGRRVKHTPPWTVGDNRQEPAPQDRSGRAGLRQQRPGLRCGLPL